VVGAVGLLAVVASGWPGFGAKVGGTIALVPCLLLLGAWLAGVRVGVRWAVPVLASGLVLFLAFALASYVLPGGGGSDIGTFAGNLLHGRAGDLLQAEGQRQRGISHAARLQLADPRRGGAGRRRALAARRTAAADPRRRIRGPSPSCACLPGSPGWSW